MERFGPTRRGGPVFRWLGKPLALDLANTLMTLPDGEPVDLLVGAGLSQWLVAERSRLGDCAFAVAHRAQIYALRDAVRRLFEASVNGEFLPLEALDRINAASTAAPVVVELCSADGVDQIVERPVRSNELATLLGTLARSAITVLGGPDRERLRLCTAPSCGMFFLGSRRWCSEPCGNRARVARHQSRRRNGADGSQTPTGSKRRTEPRAAAFGPSRGERD